LTNPASPASATATDTSASAMNTVRSPSPRGATGAAGTAAGPPPKCASSGTCDPWGRSFISFPALTSAASASTMPNPVFTS